MGQLVEHGATGVLLRNGGHFIKGCVRCAALDFFGISAAKLPIERLYFNRGGGALGFQRRNYRLSGYTLIVGAE